ARRKFFDVRKQPRRAACAVKDEVAAWRAASAAVGRDGIRRAIRRRQQRRDDRHPLIAFARVLWHAADEAADERMLVLCGVEQYAAILRSDTDAEAVADSHRRLADGARLGRGQRFVHFWSIERRQTERRVPVLERDGRD